jgi:hypothetical protein
MRVAAETESESSRRRTERISKSSCQAADAGGAPTAPRTQPTYRRMLGTTTARASQSSSARPDSARSAAADCSVPTTYQRLVFFLLTLVFFAARCAASANFLRSESLRCRVVLSRGARERADRCSTTWRKTCRLATPSADRSTRYRIANRSPRCCSIVVDVVHFLPRRRLVRALVHRTLLIESKLTHHSFDVRLCVVVFVTDMGAFKYLEELYKKKQSDVLRFLFRIRCWEYRYAVRLRTSLP